MAGKVIDVKGSNNFIGVGCDGVILHNCNNCIVEPSTIGLTAINCSNKTFSPADGGKTYINNGIVQGNLDMMITGSAPRIVNGTHNFYYVDSSLGIAIALVDIVAIKNRIIYLKILDDSNGFVIDSYWGGGVIDGHSLPYSTGLDNNEGIAITSDGTDLFILLDKVSPGHGGGGGGGGGGGSGAIIDLGNRITGSELIDLGNRV